MTNEDDGVESEGGVVRLSSKDDVRDNDDGGGVAGLNANDVDGSGGGRNDGGGGGGDIGVVAVGAAAGASAVVGAAAAVGAVAVAAANRRFLFSTNRKSFSGNDGIIRLRVGVATFSSSFS